MIMTKVPTTMTMQAQIAIRSTFQNKKKQKSTNENHRKLPQNHTKNGPKRGAKNGPKMEHGIFSH